MKASNVKDTAGEGVEATVNGVQVQVGSRRLAKRMGWGMGEGQQSAARACLGPLASLFGTSGVNKEEMLNLDKQITEMEESGQTVCYLGIAGRLAAVFSVADAPRPEAAQAVTDLRGYGVEVVMLTGDRQLTAKAIAKQLSVKTVKAELLPEDKVKAVSELKDEFRSSPCLPCLSSREGAVAMVGDGINDAAALAASSVGIAMGAAGTQVALESAHVILMDSDLSKLVLSVRLGRYAVRKIKQNISFAMISKLVMVAITMAGFASLWGAILADLGAMLVVTINASMVLGLRRQTPEARHLGHGSMSEDLEQGALSKAPLPAKI
jgi:Cd2+/Zn2+-exporting ATPase